MTNPDDREHCGGKSRSALSDEPDTPTPTRMPADWTPAPELGEWTRRAVCAGQPTAYWVGAWDEAEPATARRWQRDALAMCGLCPVAGDCRAYATTFPATGVWGGAVFHRGRQR